MPPDSQVTHGAQSDVPAARSALRRVIWRTVSVPVATALGLILVAVAIPTVAGASRPVADAAADDSVAQTNLVNTVIGAKSFYALNRNGSYRPTRALIKKLKHDEPKLTFVGATTASQNSHRVSLQVSGDGQQLMVVTWSASGTCWAVSDSNDSSQPARERAELGLRAPAGD